MGRAVPPTVSPTARPLRRHADCRPGRPMCSSMSSASASAPNVESVGLATPASMRLIFALWQAGQWRRPALGQSGAEPGAERLTAAIRQACGIRHGLLARRHATSKVSRSRVPGAVRHRPGAGPEPPSDYARRISTGVRRITEPRRQLAQCRSSPQLRSPTRTALVPRSPQLRSAPRSVQKKALRRVLEIIGVQTELEERGTVSPADAHGADGASPARKEGEDAGCRVCAASDGAQAAVHPVLERRPRPRGPEDEDGDAFGGHADSMRWAACRT